MLVAQGERVMSTDELTGVQALERKAPGLPMAPGKVERREFEYIRHGTRSFIISRDVVSGQVVEPLCGPTRTEADFLAHIQEVIASDPTAQRWSACGGWLTILTPTAPSPWCGWWRRSLDWI